MGYVTFLKRSETFPVGLSIYNFPESDGKFHDDIEILMLLDGTASLQVRGESYSMVSEDVVLVNSNDYHLVTRATGNAISLLFLPRYFFDEANIHFELNSCGHTEDVRYDAVRHILCQLIRTNSSGYNKYETFSLLFSLTGILMNQFRVSNTGHAAVSSTHITSIMDYIEKNYRKELSLDQVADYFHLNYAYLSALFRKATGLTFLKFYNNVRLSHALQDLLRTDDSIQQIALRNGYTDTRSFNAAFKRDYGMLPSEYRKEAKNPDPVGDQDICYDYMQYETIVKYTAGADFELQQESAVEKYPLSMTIPPFSYRAEGSPLKHRYRKLLNISGCRSLLYSDIQDMVRRVQKEAPYEYVTLRGIFSDDMMVYTEDEHGQPQFSFVMLDKVLDFLLSVRLKPFISLSFMPIMLARDSGRFLAMGHYNVSPPKDMNKWTRLVRAFYEHIREKYGQEKEREWLYTIWSQADSGTAYTQWSDPQLFFRFYKATFDCIKTWDPQIRVGSPSMILFEQEDGFADQFFRFAGREGCLPDFITLQYFDTNFYTREVDLRHRIKVITENDIKRMDELNSDPMGFTKYIRNIKRKCRSLGLGHLPIYLTEWNLTVSQRNYLNDTCFKSCYLARNLLINYDMLDAFGIRTLSDMNDEYPVPERLFHGGVGAFTYNGIPKSQYYLTRMLSYLGNRKLADGAGYFITRTEEGQIVIVLYNYEHYSSYISRTFNIDEERESRYEAFTKQRTLVMNLTITDVGAGACTAVSFYTNRSRGNAYDIWARIGRPSCNDEFGMLLLKEQVLPGEEVRRLPVEGGVVRLSCRMEPLEVRMIYISFDK